MIRWILLFIWVCSAQLLWATSKAVSIYNWSGYLPSSILKQFTQETGIRVYSNSYDSNEALYTKLKLVPHHGYDVVVPSSYITHRMIQEEMLHSLDKIHLPNMQYVDHQFLNKPYDPHNQYSIPYLFSSSGMVINKRHDHSKTFIDWHMMWQPHFKKQLLLLDDIRELFSISLLVLGFSPNTKNPLEIQKAYEKLRELLGNVRVFSSEGVADLYTSEELMVGIGWSGDIDCAHQMNPNIQFVYPKSGYILSIDNLAIPKGAKNISEAYQLINFLLRPDIAAEISRVSSYGTTNAAARKKLPADMLSNALVYPDADTLKRGILLLSVGEQTALYEKYWERLKIEG